MDREPPHQRGDFPGEARLAEHGLGEAAAVGMPHEQLGCVHRSQAGDARRVVRTGFREHVNCAEGRFTGGNDFGLDIIFLDAGSHRRPLPFRQPKSLDARSV